ncbi:MAG: DNA polymerase III subunit chi [Pseudomonadota bacterium]
MKQVDFYLIGNELADAKYKLASRLANKLKRLSKRVLIITEDSTSTDQLSEVMWSFRRTSFLPHERVEQLVGQHELSHSELEALDFVTIGDHLSVNAKLLESEFDVLINLASDVPIFNHHFNRIAEIVEANEDAKVAARTRFKRYQGEGFEIATHEIQL